MSARVGGRLASISAMLILVCGAGITWAAPIRSSSAQEHLPTIDASFENASPVSWQVDLNGTLQVYLVYDQELGSSNRAAGHIHFRIDADAGTQVTVEFNNLENIWNGRPGSVARELKVVAISENGKHWRSFPLESLPDNRIRLAIKMPGPSLYVARVEPYRLTDLERMLASIRGNPAVEISSIGKTVEGRPLEIIRVGEPNAAHRVFVRARAHPWESGGNWVLEGLIRALLKEEGFRQRYCTYILPMANKDGVAHGRTRFNMNGKDLNRGWEQAADRQLAPENYALEQWLEKMRNENHAPEFALELHNDGQGQLHLARVPTSENPYLQRMSRFETLLRKHTWFSEGSVSSFNARPGLPQPATLADGWLARYGLDAAVLEFNCNWIAGLNDYPSAAHWQELGERLATVFDLYFR